MLCAQLVHEQKSRVASCWPYDMVNIKRYTCAMEAEGLGMHHWRKSALWFTMPREHAKLVNCSAEGQPVSLPPHLQPT